MSIKLVQWEDSAVTPTEDRIIYDNGYNGVIEGCNITSLGLNMLHITDGYIRLLGGLVEIVGQDIEVETSGGGTKQGQLWVRLDLGSSEPVQFMTEAADTRTTLTQETDANFTNGVFEFQLATYNISETTISNLAVTAASAPTMKRLFDDVVTAANEAETSTTTPRDADLLGGHAPSYFATNDSLISFYDVSQRENIQLDSAWVTGTRTITYTATKDCITGGRLSLNGINISTDIKINNYLISRCYQMMSANSIVDYPVNIPLKKGQTLTITITANNSSDKSFLSFLAYGMLK